MQSTKKLFTLEDPAIDEILLSVRSVVYDRYGVFADDVLISIHESQFGAVAHCKQLIQKQAQSRESISAPCRRHGDSA